jgi:uncharacterized membrane protein
MARIIIISVFGLLIRLLFLNIKPAWMDEVSTVLFSLGNSSYLLPVDQVVELPQFMASLTRNADATAIDTIYFLLSENNHPPFYFFFAHIWMDLFSRAGEVPSLAVARAFSVLCSIGAIPAAFWAARTAFKSSAAGYWSAALMAVSPFGVFMAQEARHYGLAITLVTFSLACFAAVVARLWIYQKLPPWLCGLWLTTHVVAFSTHYFYGLTFAAQSLVIGVLALQQSRHKGLAWLGAAVWRRVYLTLLTSVLLMATWLPVMLNFYGSTQADNVRADFTQLSNWINPIFQMLALWVLTVLTPITFFADTPLKITAIVLSGVFMLGVLIWMVPILWRRLGHLRRSPKNYQGLFTIGGFCLAMFGLFAIVCYGYGADITRGFRYQFTYYPAIVILLGRMLSVQLPTQHRQGSQIQASNRPPGWFSKIFPSNYQHGQIIWAISCLSALFVVTNLAFPKFYAPDRFVPFMQTHSEFPIVLGAVAPIEPKPTVVGTEVLSVAWEIARHFPPEKTTSGWSAPPKFVVVRTGYGAQSPPDTILSQALEDVSRPFDLWTLNYAPDLSQEDCQSASQMPQGNKGSYHYTHYVCDSDFSVSP